MSPLLLLITIFTVTVMAVCANNYSFFPFYPASEVSSFYNKTVLLNVMKLDNASEEWVLRNCRSAVIVNTSTSLQQHLGLIYPSCGYYIHSSSALKVRMRTNITGSPHGYNSAFNVLPDTSLGQTYYVSTIYNASEEHICAIQAPYTTPVNIVVTLPRELLHAVTINGTKMDNINTSLTVPNGQAVKLSSFSPLRHVLIQSSSGPFSVFCAEQHVRYQLKPSHHCGKGFNFSCPKNAFVSHCHVFLTCIASCQNKLTLSNSTGFRKQVVQSSCIFSHDLVSGEDLNLRSTHKICVLLLQYSQKHDIIWTEVEMISSLETHFMNSTRSTTSHNLSTLNILTTQKSNPVTGISLGHTNSLSQTNLPIRMMNSSTQGAGFTIQTSSAESTGNPSSKKTSVSASPLISRIVSQTMYQRTSMTSYKETSSSSEQTSNYRASPSILMNQSSYLGQSIPNAGSTNTPFTTFRHNDAAISSNTPAFQPLKTSHLYTSATSRSIAKDECKCSQGEYCIELKQSTLNSSTLEEKLEHLHSVLTVNKTRLNSFVRQKRCANDERPSARNLGYVGVIVISVCIGSIVMCDLITLCESRLKYTRD